jgi:hypothetical protein
MVEVRGVESGIAPSENSLSEESEWTGAVRKGQKMP